MLVNNSAHAPSLGLVEAGVDEQSDDPGRQGWQLLVVLVIVQQLIDRLGLLGLTLLAISSAAACHSPTLSPSATVGDGEPTPLSFVLALQRCHRSRFALLHRIVALRPHRRQLRL